MEEKTARNTKRSMLDKKHDISFYYNHIAWRGWTFKEFFLKETED